MLLAFQKRAETGLSGWRERTRSGYLSQKWVLEPEIDIPREQWLNNSANDKDLSGKKMTPFKKLKPLSDTLRKALKKHWKTGTCLAVDESIQRFMAVLKKFLTYLANPHRRASRYGSWQMRAIC